MTEKSYLTVSEAAAEMRCHPETIRRLVRAGRLPRLQVGSLIRIPREAIEAMVGTREVAS